MERPLEVFVVHGVRGIKPEFFLKDPARSRVFFHVLNSFHFKEHYDVFQTFCLT